MHQGSFIVSLKTKWNLKRDSICQAEHGEIGKCRTNVLLDHQIVQSRPEMPFCYVSVTLPGPRDNVTYPGVPDIILNDFIFIEPTKVPIV